MRCEGMARFSPTPPDTNAARSLPHYSLSGRHQTRLPFRSSSAQEVWRRRTVVDLDAVGGFQPRPTVNQQDVGEQRQSHLVRLRGSTNWSRMKNEEVGCMSTGHAGISSQLMIVPNLVGDISWPPYAVRLMTLQATSSCGGRGGHTNSLTEEVHADCSGTCVLDVIRLHFIPAHGLNWPPGQSQTGLLVQRTLHSGAVHAA